MVLRVTGRVEASVRVDPERVTLIGNAGKKIDATVRIVPETKEPFSIVSISALRGTEIAYRLQPVDEGGKRMYLLHVENNKQNPGRYYDKIFLKTDSTVVETITVIVSGDIRTEDKQEKPAL